jgi:ABC-type Fe3+/spermidine/putrescine transport system ATPase subunit
VTGSLSFSAISLIDLTKAYTEQVAVAQLDLTIAAGELMVFVGPSGCGKTTTLRMIAGFVPPTAGTIRIGERDVTRLPPRQRSIGMVFQDYALFPSMTVRQNIAFGLEEHRATRAEIDRRVDEMLDLIRMRPLSGRLPRELSGGQQQRVALARALAYRPSVLLMDEPLGALDQKLREDMQREIVNVQKQLGITTIFVTHDQQEAMALADRILVMNAGRMEQLGTPREVYDTPASLFTASFIGRSNRLSGVVEQVEAGMAALDLPSGERLVARAAGASVQPGDQVVCLVRPERLKLVPATGAAGLNRLHVRLQRQTYLGNVVEILGMLGAGGGEITLQLDPAEVSLPALPADTTVSFAAQDAVVFGAGV